MSISADTMWILVTSGLIAHADGVLDGAECELLLAIIEEEAGPEEYSEWLGTIGDKEGLERLLEGLPTPEPEKHRDLLAAAWSMALVDGERCDAEVAVLESIAGRLGVESVQLEFWREAWTAGEREFAAAAADSMAMVLGGDGPVFPSDRGAVKEAVEHLPTTEAHREELLASAAVPALRGEDVARRLAGMPSQRRLQVMRLIAPLAGESDRKAEAIGRYLDLAENSGLGRERGQALLDRA